MLYCADNQLCIVFEYYSNINITIIFALSFPSRTTYVPDIIILRVLL